MMIYLEYAGNTYAKHAKNLGMLRTFGATSVPTNANGGQGADLQPMVLGKQSHLDDFYHEGNPT